MRRVVAWALVAVFLFPTVAVAYAPTVPEPVPAHPDGRWYAGALNSSFSDNLSGPLGFKSNYQTFGINSDGSMGIAPTSTPGYSNWRWEGSKSAYLAYNDGSQQTVRFAARVRPWFADPVESEGATSVAYYVSLVFGAVTGGPTECQWTVSDTDWYVEMPVYAGMSKVSAKMTNASLPGSGGYARSTEPAPPTNADAWTYHDGHDSAATGNGTSVGYSFKSMYYYYRSDPSTTTWSVRRRAIWSSRGTKSGVAAVEQSSTVVVADAGTVPRPSGTSLPELRTLSNASGGGGLTFIPLWFKSESLPYQYVLPQLGPASEPVEIRALGGVSGVAVMAVNPDPAILPPMDDVNAPEGWPPEHDNGVSPTQTVEPIVDLPGFTDALPGWVKDAIDKLLGQMRGWADGAVSWLVPLEWLSEWGDG